MSKLKELREEKKCRQIDLAREIGIARQTLSCYELGTIKPPLDKAKKLADFFNCSIEEIFFDD